MQKITLGLHANTLHRKDPSVKGTNSKNQSGRLITSCKGIRIHKPDNYGQKKRKRRGKKRSTLSVGAKRQNAWTRDFVNPKKRGWSRPADPEV